MLSASAENSRYQVYAAPYVSVGGVGTYVKVCSAVHPAPFHNVSNQAHNNFTFNGVVGFSAGSVEIGVYAYYVKSAGDDPFAINLVWGEVSIAEV
jgi:hypothetical protein